MKAKLRPQSIEIKEKKYSLKLTYRNEEIYQNDALVKQIIKAISICKHNFLKYFKYYLYGVLVIIN